MHPSKPLIWIAPRSLLKRLTRNRDSRSLPFAAEDLSSRWPKVAALLRQGHHLVFLGTQELSRLEPFWVRSYRPNGIPAHCSASRTGPFAHASIRYTPLACRCFYLSPPTAYAYHGFDDEPRADLIPLVTATDPYGSVVGHPGILLKHFHGSTRSNSFNGARWYLFAFENPEDALPLKAWRQLLVEIESQTHPGISISYFLPEHACYDAGEEVQLICKIRNTGSDIACVNLQIGVSLNQKGEPWPLADCSRTLCVGDEETVLARWRIPRSTAKEQVVFRASVSHEDRFLYGPEREATRKVVDTELCAVLVRSKPALQSGPPVRVDAVRLDIDGQRGLHRGTHYYPTSDFYGGMWRHFDVRRAWNDFATMRSNGIRFVRIWAPPQLSESTLRVLDACVQMCQQLGLVVDLTIFTQWVGELSIDLPAFHAKWLFASHRDYNIDSASFRRIDLQQRYAEILASRYRNVRGLIWNIANECCLNQPDRDQLGDGWLDPDYRKLPPPYDLNHALNQWLTRIRRVIRSTGCRQPIIAAYSYPMRGGTTSVFSNQVGDIASFHEYGPLVYSPAHDTTADGKPLVLEEFGFHKSQFEKPLPDASNTQDARFHWYDKIMHFALGQRLAGACSYEWGVSWLAKTLPADRCYRKYVSMLKRPDPRFGWRAYSGRWPVGGMGICPWAASFPYGMIHPGVSLPTETVQAMRRLGWVAEDLAFHPRRKSVYLLIPLEFSPLSRSEGYRRKMDLILLTIQNLWKAHVDFGIVQEHTSSRIPSSAKMIIVPAEDPVSPSLRRTLARLRRQGKTLYVGPRSGWERAPELDPVAVRGGDRLILQTRDIQGGIVYVLSNEKDTQHLQSWIPITIHRRCTTGAAIKARKVTLRTRSGNEVSLELRTLGMAAEIDRQVALAESSGTLVLNGQWVADSGGKRYSLKALDRKSLLTTSHMLVVPYEPMQLRLHGVRWRKAEIINPDTGEVVGHLKPSSKGDATHLAVEQTHTCYAIRLSAGN